VAESILGKSLLLLYDKYHQGYRLSTKRNIDCTIRETREVVKITVISCSLHPQSRSFVLARDTVANLQALGAEVTLYDLRTYELPFCDDGPSYDHPHTKEINAAIAGAEAVLLAVPIYNFDVNAAAKNLLELAGDAWNHKLVGFLCTAGERNSYMSVMGLANSLMLDFRCIIIPRFVYAVGSDFGDDRQPTMHVTSPTIKERLQQLATATVTLARALDGITVA
jgi:FMN reductase